MKSFVASVIVGIAFAIGMAYILDGNFQMDSHAAFSTEGARVGSPGDNLIVE